MNPSMLHTSEALCSQTDPELFFPQDDYDYGTLYSTYTDKNMAKYLCAQCPLTLKCLRTALDNKEDHGIWGGSMPRERRYLRTKAQAEAFVSKLKSEYGKPKRRVRKS